MYIPHLRSINNYHHCDLLRLVILLYIGWFSSSWDANSLKVFFFFVPVILFVSFFMIEFIQHDQIFVKLVSKTFIELRVCLEYFHYNLKYVHCLVHLSDRPIPVETVIEEVDYSTGLSISFEVMQ